MHSETAYSQPLEIDQADVRTRAMPDGTPAVTGYYPNLPGTIKHPVGGNLVFDDLYPGTINVGSLDHTEKIDQHSWLQVSNRWTPPPDTTRPSGRQDPITDGPPQPFLDDMSIAYNRRQGTSVTAHLDAPGIQFAAFGSQDGATWTYAQSTQRSLAPYDPSQLDPTTGQMPDTLRALAPSSPHGWTEQPPVLSQAENNLKAASLKQQVPGKQELVADSTYAGQSYGMTTRHVTGQPGTSTISRGRGATGGRGTSNRG